MSCAAPSLCVADLGMPEGDEADRPLAAPARAVDGAGTLIVNPHDDTTAGEHHPDGRCGRNAMDPLIWGDPLPGLSLNEVCG